MNGNKLNRLSIHARYEINKTGINISNQGNERIGQ